MNLTRLDELMRPWSLSPALLATWSDEPPEAALLAEPLGLPVVRVDRPPAPWPPSTSVVVDVGGLAGHVPGDGPDDRRGGQGERDAPVQARLGHALGGVDDLVREVPEGRLLAHGARRATSAIAPGVVNPASMHLAMKAALKSCRASMRLP
jgi:hypothetical protein